MNSGAEVKSIPALREWLAALGTFRTEGLEVLASLSLAIQHAADWLEDQQQRWQHEIRRAEDDVLRAKNELANRQFPDYSGRIPDCSVQEEALRLAERRLEHAEDQQAIVRRWTIHLPRMVNEAFEGSARRLMQFLEADLPRGIAMLDQQLRSLESYATG